MNKVFTTLIAVTLSFCAVSAFAEDVQNDSAEPVKFSMASLQNSSGSVYMKAVEMAFKTNGSKELPEEVTAVLVTLSEGRKVSKHATFQFSVKNGVGFVVYNLKKNIF